MKNIGLVSISFREKCVSEIVRLCCETNLTHIEWGGDVHCPPCDIQRAREISMLMKNNGLAAHCYGSYFRLGVNPVSDFEKVCETAAALGAPCIRIWAFNKQYHECDAETCKRVEAEAKEVFEIAKKHGLCINFEYHRNSLTHTADGALRLFSAVNADNLRIHWQPNPEISFSDNLRELSALPRLDAVHVFAWEFENGENIRCPLAKHKDKWTEYIKLAKEKNPDCVFALEFFKDNSDTQFVNDAKTLSEIIESI